MTDPKNYAVFLYPQAIEALGEPIKPYLRDAPGGTHIVCSEIDASGALFEMTLAGKGPNGEALELEIMGAFTSGLASLRRASAGLFLLALPTAIPGYDHAFDAADVPIALVHGWHDEICPVDAVIDFARARSATLHLVRDDHRLGAHVDWCAAVFRDFLVGLG